MYEYYEKKGHYSLDNYLRVNRKTGETNVLGRFGTWEPYEGTVDRWSGDYRWVSGEYIKKATRITIELNHAYSKGL